MLPNLHARLFLLLLLVVATEVRDGSVLQEFLHFPLFAFIHRHFLGRTIFEFCNLYVVSGVRVDFVVKLVRFLLLLFLHRDDGRVGFLREFF